MSVPCLRLGSMMATLLLILLKQWKGCVFIALDKEDVNSARLTLYFIYSDLSLLFLSPVW